MQIFRGRFRQVGCLWMIIVMLLNMMSLTMAETYSWDCAICGRQGNTGNYCGGCGNVAPWKTDEDSRNNDNQDPKTDEMVVPDLTDSDLIAWEIGEVVRFGYYEQDTSLDGTEPIEWIILDVKDGNALLISRLALDVVAYNKKLTDTTWEKSSLRRWLNDDFMQAAFSENEQGLIVTKELTTVNRSGKSKVTKDNIFVLSGSEAKELFTGRRALRKCNPSEYAREKLIAYLNETYDNSGNESNDSSARWAERTEWASWWLRSETVLYLNGYVDVMNYNSNSKAYTYGTHKEDDGMICVRPALWVRIE